MRTSKVHRIFDDVCAYCADEFVDVGDKSFGRDTGVNIDIIVWDTVLSRFHI